MVPSADQATFLVVLSKKLVPREELQALADEARLASVPLLRALEKRLDADAHQRVLQTLARHARACSKCTLVTFLLPKQTEAGTPCEHCGGALLPPASQGSHEPGSASDPDALRAFFARGTELAKTVQAEPGAAGAPGEITLHEPQGQAPEPSERNESPAPEGPTHAATEGSDTTIPRIPGYEVIRELGRGGMGRVLLACNENGQEVAIKVLQDRSRQSFLRRFQREERLQGLLTGKAGFVSLLDSGETSDGPYFVMPYLRGGTLRDRMRRGLMVEIDRSVALVHALAIALGSAHEAGIVHRDLKPENVLFSVLGKPFVADLGLAKHFRHDVPGASASISVTKTGQMLGTRGYMAFEQMFDAKNVGPEADVFALGAMLYECLTGRCPTYNGRKPVTTYRPGVPEWLVTLTERALAREPEARFPDGAAFARAIAAAGPSSASPALFPLPSPDILERDVTSRATTEVGVRLMDEIPRDPTPPSPTPDVPTPTLLSEAPDRPP